MNIIYCFKFFFDLTFFEYNIDENGNFKEGTRGSSLDVLARKALWAIRQFKNADEKELAKTKIAISNKEWLKFVQAK